jgi:hypothetical protein
MRAIRTSGLMSGDGKRGGAPASVLAPILDSTKLYKMRLMQRDFRITPRWSASFWPMSEWCNTGVMAPRLYKVPGGGQTVRDQPSDLQPPGSSVEIFDVAAVDIGKSVFFGCISNKDQSP